MADGAVTYNAWAAARLREGAEPDTIDASRLSGIYVEWLGACRSANGSADRRTTFDQFVAAHPQGRHLVAAVFAVPSGAPAPEPQARASELVLVDVPPLPHKAGLTAAQARLAGETGQYLDQIADYVHLIANTLPREFSVGAALFTLSLAVARRLHISTYFDPQIFPVLWVLWVAESTIFHKTTGLNLARRLCRQVMPHLMLPEESSNDALIQDLAGRAPTNMEQLSLWEKQRIDRGRLHAGQRGIVVDEASALFSSFRKDYNLGKLEVFLKAYDCDEEKVYSTLKHGNVYMRWLYLPLLGATTPAAIQQAANLQMWQMGFWPRFTPLVPERVFPEPLRHSDDVIPRPQVLDQTLHGLLARLPAPQVGLTEPTPPASIQAPYDKEVWKAWTAYDDAMSHELQHPDILADDRLRKLYGRLPVKLLQVATLLAALDWPAKQAAPRIRMCHYAAAHNICESWRVNAHRFVTVMDRPLSGEDFERRMLSMVTQLGQRGILATTRELQRVLHWPREKVQALLLQMESDGLIEAQDTASKRTRVWKVVSE